MDWLQAREQIASSVHIGQDLNTSRSNHRKVLSTEWRCNRYSYGGQAGLLVQIGSSPQSAIEIPWQMLKACYESLALAGEYDGSTFAKLYPVQTRHHGCHVHVVGQLLLTSGLAVQLDERKYGLPKSSR